ncbi:MAG: lasso RiPP family leader peptide-containing protein [Parasphingorhabdus sp.]
MNTSEKMAYIKPDLTEVGSFEEVTLGSSTGSALDASFPVGTLITDLTFS